MTKAPQMAGFAKKFHGVYDAMMQPLCEKLEMPQTALDILLYLANNPDHNSARDICRFRFLKPGIVSFHIERLVREGLLARSVAEDDRRVYRLVCTEKAAPIIEQGRALQMRFGRAITEGLDDAALAALRQTLATIDGNMERLLRGQRAETEESEC